MKSDFKHPRLLLVLAVICAAMCVLVLTGVLYIQDSFGRWIFGLIWALVALVWLGQYLYITGKGRRHD